MSKLAFDEFAAVDFESWLERVQKDLKGKALASLNWSFTDGLSIAPFQPRDQKKKAPLLRHKQTNSWMIGGYLDTSEFKGWKAVNEELLSGLINGLEAPILFFDQSLKKNDWQEILNGVELSYITIGIKWAKGINHWDSVTSFIEYINSQYSDRKDQLNGCFLIDPFTDLEQWGNDVSLLAKALPNFGYGWICTEVQSNDFANELAMLSAKLSELLVGLRERGQALEPFLQNLRIGVSISANYFPEIAKLRVLKIMVENIKKGFGIMEQHSPQVIGMLQPISASEGKDANLIALTTQALSAVVGGVDHLFMQPSAVANDIYGPTFNNRMNNNLQHLLKMEAYLDRVIDPAAGSYYIEQMTKLLGEQAWRAFQKIEAQGGWLKHQTTVS